MDPRFKNMSSLTDEERFQIYGRLVLLVSQHPTHAQVKKERTDTFQEPLLLTLPEDVATSSEHDINANEILSIGKMCMPFTLVYVNK
jgi:hypothetical protein